jgi:type IV pilus assembly protein PilX
MTSIHRAGLPAPRGAQRGIVLFIALIAMVVLSLAGVGLMRSVDSASSVAANIGFRQASMAQVNFEVEKAVDALYKHKNAVIVDPTNDDVANNYYASLQAGEKKDGAPAVLSGSYSTMKAAYKAAGLTEDVDATTGIESRLVIERVCTTTGAATIIICDLLPPKVSPGGTDNEVKRIPIPPIPHYRISVRVDLPNTNAHSIAQTFLR